MNTIETEKITRPTIMEVDLDNLYYNIQQIKNIVGDSVELMPVIKANGYGTYINHRIDVLNSFDIVAVATVDEAVEVRNVGYQKEIFVLNQPFKDEIEKIIEYDIAVGVSSKDFIRAVSEIDSNMKIHIEIETGMGRTGVSIDELEDYLTNLPANVEVEGVYTHLSSADIDTEYTKMQIELFNTALEKITNIIGPVKYIHAGASNGIINYTDSHFNLVRPGIILYGYPSSEDTLEKIKLKPIAKLKSRINFIKTVEKDTSISYSRSYITKRKTKVATVPLGYADGFRRDFSNGWKVMINGTKVPVIGKVCMDSFMVDVSEIENVAVGDEVIIWDNENITLEQLAEKCGTINYEILSTISSRVPRKF